MSIGAGDTFTSKRGFQRDAIANRTGRTFTSAAMGRTCPVSTTSYTSSTASPRSHAVTDPDRRRNVGDSEVVACHVVYADGNSDHAGMVTCSQPSSQPCASPGVISGRVG